MKKSNKILWVLFLISNLQSLPIVFFPQLNQLAQFLNISISVISVALIYSWCKTESTERNSVAPGHSALWAALFAVIFIPVYFFRTRSNKLQAVKSTAKSFLFLLAMSLVEIVASFIT